MLLDASGTGSRAERHGRRVVVAALLVLSVAAIAYTLREALLMQTMDHETMRAPTFAPIDVAFVLAMWVAMMIAMMTPSIIPMVLAFAAINLRRRGRGAASVGTGVFVGGYLLAWVGYSALATVVQLALHAWGVLDPMMAQTSRVWAAVMFVIAGLYQFSRLKTACLVRCRSTHAFVLTEWRDGAAGAMVMGFRHGLFCIGCCAGLMALLFAVAVMDVRWVALLAVVMGIEKLLPKPDFWRRVIGAVLTIAGLLLGMNAIP